MKVITEDSIRLKLRRKELAAGGVVNVTAAQLLTPSAESYLREQQITVKRALAATVSSAIVEPLQQAVEGSKVESGRTVDKVGAAAVLARRQEQLAIYEVVNQVHKLHNLFFFPQLSDQQFPAAVWLHWEEQQNWLQAFARQLLGQGPSVTEPHFLSELPEKAPCRSWLFCRNELLQQAEALLNLLCRQQGHLPADCIALFAAWVGKLTVMLGGTAWN